MSEGWSPLKKALATSQRDRTPLDQLNDIESRLLDIGLELQSLERLEREIKAIAEFQRAQATRVPGWGFAVLLGIIFLVATRLF